MKLIAWSSRGGRLLLGVVLSVVLLIEGDTPARVIGVVLLGSCLLIVGRLARKHFAKTSA